MTNNEPAPTVVPSMPEGEDPSGALSAIMVHNADSIQSVIDVYGAQMVCDFFMNVSAALAAQYGLTSMSIDDTESAPTASEE